MAHYKEYYNFTDGRKAIIGMFAACDSKRPMFFEYDVIINQFSPNEEKITFGEDKKAAEKYMKDNGWTECYWDKNCKLHYKRR